MITRRRLMAAVPAGIALGATSAFAAACDGPGSGPPMPTDPVSLQAALGQLLARRAAALSSGDEQAWLADVNPADAGLIAAERFRFANLRQLPLASHRFLSASGMADRAAPVKVCLVMRLTIDDDQSVVYYTYTTGIIDGVLRIIGIVPGWDDPHARVRDDEEQPPWDLEPLRSATRDNVTVFSGVASPWVPGQYLPEAVRAAHYVRGMWSDRISAPGFVVFLADEAQWVSWFHRGQGHPQAVGFAHFGTIVDDRGHPKMLAGMLLAGKQKASACARVVLRMSALTDPGVRYGTLVHEITHALTPQLIRNRSIDLAGGDGMNDQPHWVVEGYARYVEDTATAGKDLTLDTVRSGWRKYKPAVGEIAAKNSDFYSADDPERTSFNYALAAAYFHAADRLKGSQGAADLFRILAASGIQLTANSTFMINQYIRESGLDPIRFWDAISRWIS